MTITLAIPAAALAPSTRPLRTVVRERSESVADLHAAEFIDGPDGRCEARLAVDRAGCVVAGRQRDESRRILGRELSAGWLVDGPGGKVCFVEFVRGIAEQLDVAVASNAAQTVLTITGSQSHQSPRRISLRPMISAAAAIRLRSELFSDAALTRILHGRRIVEGTFTLRPGWDPAGAGGAAENYDRSTSPDFAEVAEVFRLWVLNEDGAFSSEPFDQPAFDLAVFFDDPLEPNAPRPFGPMLAQAWIDGEHRVRAEFSVDEGQTWSDLHARIVLLRDRAGLRIVEDSLPAGFAEAGNAGTLRLRLTATLPAMRPIERLRLSGNPFAARQLSEASNWPVVPAVAIVGATSRFEELVREGTILADERDETAEMERTLTEQAAGLGLSSLALSTGGDSSSSPAHPTGLRHSTAELTLSPVDPTIRAGDRLRRIAGDGWAVDLCGACGGYPVIERVRHILNGRNVTILTLNG